MQKSRDHEGGIFPTLHGEPFEEAHEQRRRRVQDRRYDLRAPQVILA